MISGNAVLQFQFLSFFISRDWKECHIKWQIISGHSKCTIFKYSSNLWFRRLVWLERCMWPDGNQFGFAPNKRALYIPVWSSSNSEIFYTINGRLIPTTCWIRTSQSLVCRDSIKVSILSLSTLKKNGKSWLFQIGVCFFVIFIVTRFLVTSFSKSAFVHYCLYQWFFPFFFRRTVGELKTSDLEDNLKENKHFSKIILFCFCSELKPMK